ncbi:hypothetical protein A2U01_0101805, partial [Trifolium medium]|nr:hypothetical protein [Trifolium medium]
HREKQRVWVELRQNPVYPQKEQQRHKLELDPPGWSLVSLESFDEADRVQKIQMAAAVDRKVALVNHPE